MCLMRTVRFAQREALVVRTVHSNNAAEIAEG
jgi:hypothetical protein